jgi:subtilisin family serine protease
MATRWAARILTAVIACLSFSGAQASLNPTSEDLVTGDPSAEEMIAHLIPAAESAEFEVIDKHRTVDPSTGWGYLALKMDLDGEPVTFWMNESSGLMSFDFALLEQERQTLFATLDPGYRKMSPDMLQNVRDAQGGVLGAQAVGDRRLSVVFFAESADKLDAIIAAMTGTKLEAFDAVKLRDEKPPVLAPDDSGNLPTLDPPSGIFAVTADLTVADIVRVSNLDAVAAVEPEIFATPRLNVSRVRIRANTAANFSVFHGFRADIAIVDSGVDNTHPGLPFVIAEMDTSGSQQFCDGGARAGRRCDCPGGACGGGGTCVGGARAGKACNCPGSTCHEAVDDFAGHGTHVAGIAGGTDGTFTGMARLADIINAKSLGGFTIGQSFAAGMPSVAAGLAFSRGAGADVINGSYGFAGCTAPGFCSGPGRCLGPGMCTRPRVCTAPAANAGNPCVNNAACDTAPGNGVCADAGWCTAGSVGAPCATNANCDTAPGNGVCTQRSRTCNVAADCDSAAGAGDGFCAAARQCTAGNVGGACVLNRDCDAPLGAGNGVCGVGTRMCAEDDDCDSAAGANDGFCARAGRCTAPGGSAGRPCVYNFDCDSAVAAGDGLCAQAGACTAPAASVGLNCSTNANCDSAPGAGDGACNPRGDLRPCTTDAACDFPAGSGNGTCSPAGLCFATAATQGLLCQRDSDCDGVPGSGAGRCGPRPCITNANCDSAGGAGDGVCGTPTSDGSSRPSRDVDFEVYNSNITVTIAGEELSYHGKCSGGANNGQRCGYAFQCPGGTCQAAPSSPNDAFNVITVGSSNLAGPPSTVTPWSVVGPTADNRSKPDILAPGESPGADGIDSCNAHWEGRPCTAPPANVGNICTVNADCDSAPAAGDGVCGAAAANDFIDFEGTSMAAPHVAGVAGLLWDLGDRHGILTDTTYIKAAILNNARRLAGWAQPQGNVLTITQPLDRSQGTGEIDAEATYRAYMDDLRVWQQRVTATGEANSHWYWIDVPAPTDANTRIVVTLVFERHVTNPVAAAPALNDLDIRLYDPNCNLLRSSRSSVDSVEHIVFPNPGQPVLPAGRYCIEVLPFNLATGGSELYAVAANYRMHFLGKTKPCVLDFGDAPDPFTGPGKYPTRLANNGARHFDWTKEWLGNSRPEIDGELKKGTLAVQSRVDPFPSVSGEKDAIDPMDQDGVNNLVNRDAWDDGVAIGGPFIPGVPTPVFVTVQSIIDDLGFGPTGRYDQGVAAKRLYLNAWADWNGDGLWATPVEKIIGTGSPFGRVAIDPQTWGTNGRYTIGEAFVDSNGSGAWEPGESFTDTAGATEAVYVFFVIPPPAIAAEFYLRFRLDYGEDAGVLANHSGNLVQDRGQARFGEVEDYKQQKYVAGCGPSPYWVETCSAGTDVIPSNGLVSIDLGGDCIADTTIQLEGPVTVSHSDPLDDSFYFPGAAPPDGVFDVIDTEIIAMELTDGGVTIRAGAGQGQGGALAPSYGAIIQQQANPSLADSFFHVFVEVDMGGGTYLYNQSPHIISTVIDAVPPKSIYIPPTVEPCLPLFTSPIPGEGFHVANLLTGCHGVGSSCVEMLTTGACCTSDGVCTSQVSLHDCSNLGGSFTEAQDCFGDGGSVTCPTTGACCQTDGTCTEGSADACAGFVCDVTALSGAVCFGDADGNGVVNAADRGFISANIGQTVPEFLCLYDMDGNGVVNAADRGFVSANIGQCVPLPNYQNGSGLNAAGDGPDPRFPAQSGEFQGYGTTCDSITCPVVKTVDPGSDCWVTDCSGSQYSFADHPIPADFFGPGSDPFTGTVILGGIPTGPLGTDTEIARLDPLEFAINDLPSTSSTRIQVTRLDLQSCAPVIVSFGGGVGMAAYDLTVALSPSSVSDGMLTATKHSPNCGTLDLYFFVQPVFIFTEVGNPGNVVVLDTALAGVPEMELTASGMPFVQEANLPGCDPGFSPGYDCPTDEPPCCVEQCHSSFGSAPHEHCASPPECSVYCTPQTGACCLSDGSCSDTTEDDCNAQGGVYQGDGTDCAGTTCVTPTGACCLSDGSCIDGLYQIDCDAQGGTYQGDGTDCGTTSCPQPTGACCLTGGGCTDGLYQPDCDAQGGTYQGDGTNCGTTVCPQPTGACCLTGGGCLDGLYQVDCDAQGGTYQGDGTNCGTTTCANTKGVPPGSDCWTTPCGGTQYSFADNPLPPGFFGPGSDPFTGTVTLGGTPSGPLGTDTEIARLDTLVFDLDNLPSTSSVPVQVTRLTLASCSPATVTSFGGSQSTQYDVSVGLSPAPAPDGTLTATKHFPDCGRLDVVFFVRPVFVFTEVGNPGNVRVFDTAQAGIPPMQITGQDMPFVQNASLPGCDPNFSPGYDCPGGGGDPPCCVEQCHSSFGTAPHDHCVTPPECGSYCTPPTGACCYGDGSCFEITADDCNLSGGVYGGDFSTCGSVFCPTATGACCYSDGNCNDGLSESDCFNSGGNYQGDGTSCGTVTCPTTTGACCFSNGSCSDLTFNDCNAGGGSYFGDGTNCATTFCPQPTGACCYPDGSCNDGLYENDCTIGGGVYQGDGSSCATAFCPQPTGACCYSNGSCGDLSFNDCSLTGGSFQGDGTSCGTTSCPQPTGACCDLTFEFCLELTSAIACVEWGGDHWEDGAVCADDPCGFNEPTGACCLTDANCSEGQSVGDCAINGGTYQGDGSECGTVFCPMTTDCMNAVPIGDGATPFNPDLAITDGPNEPSCGFPLAHPANQYVYQDRWYSYVGSCSGTLYVDTCGGESLDTRLAVYADCGICPPAGPPLECNDDHANGTENDTGLACPDSLESSLSIPITAGQCVTIRAGVASQSGGINGADVLNVTCDAGTIGACCFSNGSCSDTTSTECTNQGGSFQGDGTNCGTTVCTAPTGACCNFSGMFCTEETADGCSLSGGSYFGDGTLCIDDPCGFITETGACCEPGGTCFDTDQPSCAFAFFPGQACFEIVCPGTGSNDDCTGAVPVGDGATPFDSTGMTTSGPIEPVCNFPFGDDNIHKDQWFTYTASCDGQLYVDTCGGFAGDPRIAIYGGCGLCPPSGPPAECNDDHGNATEADSGFSCPSGLESSLSIPTVNGSCYTIRVGTFSATTSTGLDQLNIQCVPTTFGGCCLGGGACTDTTSTDCFNQGGTFQGDGTDCSTTTCVAPTGACCNFTGQFCSELTASDCGLSGGSYFGDGVSCATNPCGFGGTTGACCTAGNCNVTDPGGCSTGGGSYLGDGTDCTGDPCGFDEPGACCDTGGSCFDTDAAGCPWTFHPAQFCFQVSCAPAGSCCQVQPGPGCGDPGIAACVCAVDPYCCNAQWDSICVGEVTGLGCGSCP